MNEQQYLFAFCFHHTLFAGCCEGVFLRELAALYHATEPDASSLPELPIQYADFAEWQRQQATGEAMAESLAYCKGQLANAVTSLSLPWIVRDHSTRCGAVMWSAQTCRLTWYETSKGSVVLGSDTR